MCKRFKIFHELVKRRLEQGEAEGSAYRDKPDGYTEWAKKEFESSGGIRLPNWNEIPKITYWNCQKEYFLSWDKCPQCGSFNKERRNIRK